MKTDLKKVLIISLGEKIVNIPKEFEFSVGEKKFLAISIIVESILDSYLEFLKSEYSYMVIVKPERWKKKIDVIAYLILCIQSLENTEHYAICQPAILYGDLLEDQKHVISQRKTHSYINFIDDAFLVLKGNTVKNFKLDQFMQNKKMNWSQFNDEINLYGFETYRLSSCMLEVEIDKEIQLNTTFPNDSIDLLNKSKLKKTYDVGIEFSFLEPTYSGTSEYATNILKVLVKIFKENKTSFQIIVDSQIIKKFNLNEYSDFIIEPAKSEENFYKLLFIPHQIYSISALEKINRICFKFVFTMLDVIALRCRYLGPPRGLDIACTLAYKYADNVIGLSKSSSEDTEAFFNERMIHRTVIPILLTKEMNKSNSALNLVDKAVTGEKFVLLMGNGFKHKAIDKALDALYDSDIKVIVVGIESGNSKFRKRFKFYASGQLSNHMMDSLYRNSSLILYPSLYEGFGLPVVAALQIGKRILVYDSLINRELKLEFDSSDLISFFDSFSDLTLIIQKILNSPIAIKKEFIVTRTWKHVSEETAAILLSDLKTTLDFDIINQRIYDIREVRKIIENSPLVKLHRLRSLVKLVLEITLRILNGYRERVVGVLLKLLGRKK